MTRQKNGALIKILILGPYLTVLYILQSTVFTHLTLFGVKPLLLPMAVVGVSLFRGRVDGGVFGLFAGILMDLSCNQNTVQFTLALTFSGLLLGILADTVLAQGFPSFLLSAVLLLLICSACQTASMAIMAGAPLRALLETAMYQCAYSLVLVLPMYYISRFLTRLL